VGSLATYFQANPDKENAALDVTSARAAEFFNTLREVRAAMNRSGKGRARSLGEGATVAGQRVDWRASSVAVRR
jgi:hypothetical protein